jgi:RNA polymerase sigma factor (sigma-70 family)
MPLAIAQRNCASVGVTGSVADLLVRVSDGEGAAWEEVQHRYGHLVSATVRSFRLQDADALDAIQMTWLRFTENAHRIHTPERLAGWLATTTRRECLGILRRARRAPELVDATTDTVADPSVGPEQRVIDADTVRTLRKLVEELTPRQRTLLRLLFTDSTRPYTEIARAAGIPPGAIGPTRARALRQLRRRLDEHGLGPGAS